MKQSKRVMTLMIAMFLSTAALANIEEFQLTFEKSGAGAGAGHESFKEQKSLKLTQRSQRQCTSSELARVTARIEQCMKSGGSADKCRSEGMAMFDAMGCSP